MVFVYFFYKVCFIYFKWNFCNDNLFMFVFDCFNFSFFVDNDFFFFSFVSFFYVVNVLNNIVCWKIRFFNDFYEFINRVRWYLNVFDNSINDFF